MSQALYRKWRPALFEDIVGQEHVTRTLQNAIRGDRVGHAYLFCGPRGTGKTTLARLLAKAVNCKHPDLAQRPDDTCSICLAINQGRFLDLIEIDAASNTSVDDVRDLRDRINFAPSEGQYKVYIIDEVHMLSTAAFNALLKTLEEPPPHAIFVLATTEEHKVPLTIKSRCQQFNVRLLTLSEIIGRLQWVTEQEGLSIEPEALQLIGREAAGSVRDGLSLLDQLITAPGDTITLERAQMVLGTASNQVIYALTEAWLSAETAHGLSIIHQSLNSGADARQFARQIVAYLRQLLLLQTGGDQLVFDIPGEQLVRMRLQAGRADHRLLIDAIKQFNDAATTSGNNWQPQLPLELAFIEAIPAHGRPAPLTVSVPAPAKAQPLPEADAPVQKAAPPPVKPVVEEIERDSAEAEVDVDSAEIIPLMLDAVTDQWHALMTHVRRQDRNLPALLAACKPLGVEEDTVVIGFDYPILRDKFDNTAQAAALVGDILGHLIGTPCRVRTVLTGQYTPPNTVTRADVEALAQELGGVVRST